MFSSVGWGEIVILMIAGLVILGPERIPGAVTWAMKSVRQLRDYATGTTAQLKEDLGVDFDDLRKPLAELNALRGMTPKSVITKHLLDGDDSIFTGKFGGDGGIKPVSQPLPPTDESSGAVSFDKPAGVAAASGKPAGNFTKSEGIPRPTPVAGETTVPATPGVGRWDAT